MLLEARIINQPEGSYFFQPETMNLPDMPSNYIEDSYAMRVIAKLFAISFYSKHKFTEEKILISWIDKKQNTIKYFISTVTPEELSIIYNISDVSDIKEASPQEYSTIQRYGRYIPCNIY